MSVDATEVRDQPTAAIQTRLIGGFLAGVALLFTTLWSLLAMSSLIGGTTFGLVPRVVTTLDLTIQLPALFVGGVLLLRKHPFGYVAAPGLLLQASAYLTGLSLITLLQEDALALPFDPIAIIPGFIIGGIGIVMIGGFVLVARKVHRSV
jgi:hypothetical protein